MKKVFVNVSILIISPVMNIDSWLDNNIHVIHHLNVFQRKGVHYVQDMQPL